MCCQETLRLDLSLLASNCDVRSMRALWMQRRGYFDSNRIFWTARKRACMVLSKVSLAVERQRARDVQAVMDLFYALKAIKAQPTLKDLVKLAKRIKGFKIYGI